MIGEAEDDADDSGDEDSKKFNCDMAQAVSQTSKAPTVCEVVEAVGCSDVRIVVERRLLFLLRRFLQHLDDD